MRRGTRSCLPTCRPASEWRMGTRSLSGSAGEEGMVEDGWRWGSGDRGWRNGWEGMGSWGRAKCWGDWKRVEFWITETAGSFRWQVHVCSRRRGEASGRQRRICFEGGEGVIPGTGVWMEEIWSGAWGRGNWGLGRGKHGGNVGTNVCWSLMFVGTCAGLCQRRSDSMSSKLSLWAPVTQAHRRRLSKECSRIECYSATIFVTVHRRTSCTMFIGFSNRLGGIVWQGGLCREPPKSCRDCVTFLHIVHLSLLWNMWMYGGWEDRGSKWSFCDVNMARCDLFLSIMH